MPGPILSTLQRLTHLICIKTRRGTYSYYPHFTDRNTEVHRGYMTYLRLHSLVRTEPEFETWQFGSRIRGDSWMSLDWRLRDTEQVGSCSWGNPWAQREMRQSGKKPDHRDLVSRAKHVLYFIERKKKGGKLKKEEKSPEFLLLNFVYFFFKFFCNVFASFHTVVLHQPAVLYTRSLTWAPLTLTRSLWSSWSPLYRGGPDAPWRNVLSSHGTRSLSRVL